MGARGREGGMGPLACNGGLSSEGRPQAVFQTLCRLGITQHPLFPGPGILVTGKGYPDVATRQLVATLSDNLPDRYACIVSAPREV